MYGGNFLSGNWQHSVRYLLPVSSVLVRPYFSPYLVTFFSLFVSYFYTVASPTTSARAALFSAVLDNNLTLTELRCQQSAFPDP
jgi:hypothetical protein